MRMASQLAPAKEEQVEEDDFGLEDAPETPRRKALREIKKARGQAAVEEDRANQSNL